MVFIEKLIKTALPIVEHPDFPQEKFRHMPKKSKGSFFSKKRRASKSKGSYAHKGSKRKDSKRKDYRSK